MGGSIISLDLRSIIYEAGTVPFDCESDLSDLQFISISQFLSPLRAVGKVTNSAGVLTLTGKASVKLLCVCDRCGGEFETDMEIPLYAVLSEEIQDKENSDIYMLQGGYADLDEIIITAFVFSLESKTLCREDCKGICPSCGKNLNEGPCNCKHEPDSRLAVLKQLL
jgi:uncharacterized protein